MKIAALPASLEDILPFRDMHRQEMNCQIVHDRHHERGYTALYRLTVDGTAAGYGCIGNHVTKKKDVVKEFYILPAHRAAARPLFRQLIETAAALRVEAQTNDRLLMLMLYDFCVPMIVSDTILFDDAAPTSLSVPGAVFRALPVGEKPSVFAHKREPVGDWAVEMDGQVAGTGGFLCHYNPPYGDIYMEVDERFRKRGLGSFLVQEVKRACYAAGKRPAARCHIDNAASRATLQKAGLYPCARIVSADLRS